MTRHEKNKQGITEGLQTCEFFGKSRFTHRAKTDFRSFRADTYDDFMSSLLARNEGTCCLLGGKSCINLSQPVQR